MIRVVRHALLTAMPIGRGIALATAVFTALCLPTALASQADDEAAIRAAAKAYVEALGKGDAARLAALWTPDGDIVDASGQKLLGREAVSLDHPATPPEPGARPEFRIRETTLRFLTPDVAVEDGTVEVVPPAGQPLTGRFSATWVRHEGSWKLGALREARGEEPTAAAALSELDWMVGDWVVVDDHPAADKQPAIEVSTSWNESKTYLIRELRIPVEGGAPLTVTQRIGWDPLTKSIHSWVFGSDGSHGEAEWSRDGRSWVANSRAVTPDGSQSTSLNIYTYDGKDRCAWKSLPTHVGSENVPPVTLSMIRKPQAGADQPRTTP
jgi:uncharacterized protein (TIGR02246 family)